MSRKLSLLIAVISLGLQSCAVSPTSDGMPDTAQFFHLVHDQMATEEDQESGTASEVTTVLAGGWPTGADGDLVIPLGQTVQFAPGTILDCNNIEVYGTLEMLPGDGWLIIGVAGNFVNKGRVLGKKGIGYGGVVTATAPDGTALTYQTGSGSGGDGGGTPGPAQKGRGGKGGFGNGGGGAANIKRHGQPGTAIRGGTGGTGSKGRSRPGRGGRGARDYGANGADGESSLNVPLYICAWTGGGGGGRRGLSGQGIFIRVLGTYDSVGGTIDVSGQDGGSGGDGGRATGRTRCKQTGGGGGGGGGGFGGAIQVHHTGKYKPGIVMTEEGIGERGGRGGDTAGRPSGGLDGKDGRDGKPGTLVVAKVGS